MNIALSDKTKKVLAVTFGVIFGLAALLYICFLFVLPNVINLNKYTPDITKEVQKQTGLKLDIQNAKIHTTYRLGIGLKADNIKINYKDGTEFITLEKPIAEINIPSLLIGHINIDKIYTAKGGIYLAFTKDKKYTLEQYLAPLVQTPADKNVESKEAVKLPFKLHNINIIADSFSLYLNDENVSKNYTVALNDTNIHLSSLKGPLKIKTKGFIGAKNDNGSYDKYITLNINLKTKLPNLEELMAQNDDKSKKDKAQAFEFNFNPFEPLDKLAFKANLDVDLNIKNPDDFKAKGYVKLNELSLRLKDVILPESYINIDFNNNLIKADSKLYLSKDEYFQTDSSIKTGKNVKLDIKSKTTKIYLASIKSLAGAILDIINVPNDLADIKTTGYIKADINLKTDSKKIQSKGSIALADGNINYNKANLNINSIKALVDLSNNNVAIKDTSAFINGAKFLLAGKITSDSKINLKIASDPIKIKDIVNMAKEFKIVNAKDIEDFQINNGTVTLFIKIAGKLDNIQPDADVEINKFNMLVKSAKLPLSIENISIKAKPDNAKKNDFKAVIQTKNLKASIHEPQMIFTLNESTIEADSSIITIKPLIAYLQGTIIKVEGNIKDYLKEPLTDIKINGDINPDTILAFVPNEYKKAVSYKGMIPYNSNITGPLSNLKINGKVSLSPKNYINMVDIQSLRGVTNNIDFNLGVKNDMLELSDISVVSNGSKKAQLKGKVEKIYSAEPYLNNINISLPSKMKISVPMADNISFMTDADINIAGKAFSPVITGHINIDNLNYPLYSLTIETLKLNFNKSSIDAGANGIKVAGSDFSGNANISSDFYKTITINSLNYNSNYIDADALMVLADKIAKMQPAPSSTKGSSSGASSDLGIVLNTGNAQINKLKSGFITAENINYQHTLKNNTYYLNNLACLFGGGNIKGKASYNIMNGKIGVDASGTDISMKEGVKAVIGKEFIRSGTLSGTVNVTLSGATYEQQMKSLKGNASFNILNGQFTDKVTFERFLGAANVVTQGAFSSTINSVLSKIKTADTSQFKTINGKLTFAKGNANITEIKSQGPDMSLYVKGKYGILNNYADLKVTGKISTKVSSMLGPVGKFALDEQVTKVTKQAEAVVNKAATALSDKLNEKLAANSNLQAGLAILGAVKNAAQGNTETPPAAERKSAGSVVTTIIEKKVNPLFGSIDAADVANVPSLSNNAQIGNSFQVYIKGPAAAASSVKSFKWSKAQAQNAN